MLRVCVSLSGEKNVIFRVVGGGRGRNIFFRGRIKNTFSFLSVSRRSIMPPPYDFATKCFVHKKRSKKVNGSATNRVVCVHETDVCRCGNVWDNDCEKHLSWLSRNVPRLSIAPHCHWTWRTSFITQPRSNVHKQFGARKIDKRPQFFIPKAIRSWCRRLESRTNEGRGGGIDFLMIGN